MPDIKLQLPNGTHFNRDAPSKYQVLLPSCSPIELLSSQLHSLPLPEEESATETEIIIPYSSTASSGIVLVEALVYYCENEDGRCRISQTVFEFSFLKGDSDESDFLVTQLL